VLWTIDEFSAFVRDFNGSAFRLETLQTYTVPSERESLVQFLAGEEKPADHNSATHRRLRELMAAGNTWTKVKLIRRPLTDYQRYSIEWAIPGNIAAGWVHRIIDVTDRAVGLPDTDFWIYDDSKVVVLNYDQEGRPLSAEPIDTDIGQYRRWRDIAMKESIPFSEYRA
jgi:hypothetical protein